jgi:hypothetical protein
MSRENLELVRSLYAAWERGDWSPVEWADPQIQWVSGDGPSPGTWTGPEGRAEGWRDWLSGWGDFRIEVDEYRELDEERALALQILASPKRSFAELVVGRGQRARQGERLGTRAWSPDGTRVAFAEWTFPFDRSGRPRAGWYSDISTMNPGGCDRSWVSTSVHWDVRPNWAVAR